MKITLIKYICFLMYKYYEILGHIFEWVNMRSFAFDRLWRSEEENDSGESGWLSHWLFRKWQYFFPISFEWYHAYRSKWITNQAEMDGYCDNYARKSIEDGIKFEREEWPDDEYYGHIITWDDRPTDFPLWVDHICQGGWTQHNGEVQIGTHLHCIEFKTWKRTEDLLGRKSLV